MDAERFAWLSKWGRKENLTSRGSADVVILESLHHLCALYVALEAGFTSGSWRNASNGDYCEQQLTLLVDILCRIEISESQRVWTYQRLVQLRGDLTRFGVDYGSRCLKEAIVQFKPH